MSHRSKCQLYWVLWFPAHRAMKAFWIMKYQEMNMQHGIDLVLYNKHGNVGCLTIMSQIMQITSFIVLGFSLVWTWEYLLALKATQLHETSTSHITKEVKESVCMLNRAVPSKTCTMGCFCFFFSLWLMAAIYEGMLTSICCHSPHYLADEI